MLRLVTTTQDYAWGSPTAIPELLGVAPGGVPVAELWLGAHPSAPSRAVNASAGEPDGVPLDELVRRDPEAALGRDVVARFGPTLPYLLKVLAADRPLSLQVHPTLAQARAGYAAEEAAGIPVAAPHRNYRDRNHKPEMIFALTPFEALCGFRGARRSVELLSGLDAPLARELAVILRSRPALEVIPAAVRRLLDEDQQPSPAEVDEVARACAERLVQGSPFPAADRAVAVLAEAYPGDPGVVTSLLLNHVVLQPGEAMFVPAGAVHSYLRGLGIEIMASSDNVLRAGLTPKHMDIPELLAIIDYGAAPPMLISPERAYDATEVFSAPVDDFGLSVTTVDDDDDEHTLPGRGPRILFCLDGDLKVRTTAGQTQSLGRGGAVFVPAADGVVTIRGRGRAVQADVP
ncbi:MAG TPA: mannose-6-phosphate isomerase, class I [Pengzhenrongella sp.]